MADKTDKKLRLGKRYPKTKLDAASTTRDKILHLSTLMFAKKGYAAVSMKEIAASIGIKTASLYNHFDGKEDLWRAVMEHVKELYLLYFSRLKAANEGAESFEAVLENMFVELKKVVNIYTYYGFSLVQTEQFRDKQAAEINNDIFLKYSIDYIKKCFDDCVEKKLVPAFDTQTCATFFMHSVLVGINIRVHKDMRHSIPYNPTAMFSALQNFIYQSAMAGIQAEETGE